jgi:putative transposase
MRFPRIEIPEIPFHVYFRGNNKQRIFLEDKDRFVYLKQLRLAHRLFQFALHSYALMDNHVHLLIETLGSRRLSQLMHHLQLRYARYFNHTYGRVGHVFESRYHSIPIETDRYFLTVDRYIHLNPVRAGIVATPDQFQWTSYRSRLKGADAELLTHGRVLDYFGQDPIKRIHDYSDFAAEGIRQPEEWSDAQLLKIQYHGSPQFFAKLRTQSSF